MSEREQTAVLSLALIQRLNTKETRLWWCLSHTHTNTDRQILLQTQILDRNQQNIPDFSLLWVKKKFNFDWDELCLVCSDKGGGGGGGCVICFWNHCQSRAVDRRRCESWVCPLKVYVVCVCTSCVHTAVSLGVCCSTVAVVCRCCPLHLSLSLSPLLLLFAICLPTASFRLSACVCLRLSCPQQQQLVDKWQMAAAVLPDLAYFRLLSPAVWAYLHTHTHSMELITRPVVRLLLLLLQLTTTPEDTDRHSKTMHTHFHLVSTYCADCTDTYLGTSAAAVLSHSNCSGNCWLFISSDKTVKKWSVMCVLQTTVVLIGSTLLCTLLCSPTHTHTHRRTAVWY